jgi:cytochrome c-type biogenesis protein CcmH
MTFWILVSVLVVLAVVWLAPVLLREKPLRELDRKQQNITIAKERLDEIAAEHASGEMTTDVYEQVKGELEASLIDDVDDQDKDSGKQIGDNGAGKLVLLVLVLLIPLGTVGLYQHLGSPHLLEYAGGGAGRETTVEHMASGANSIEDLVEKLTKRLEQNPEDGEGWYLLARTYMSQQRYAEALEGLKKSREVLGDHPQILVGMADAAAMTRQGDLSGEPSGYLDKALELDPDNTTGLWLGGMAAQQTGKFQLAVDRWTRLVPLLAEEPQSQQQVRTMMQEAITEAAGAGIKIEEPKVDTPASKAILVKVAANVPDSVSKDSSVFVFATAASGPPMPLAAIKVELSKLPVEIMLDDSSAMMPELSLSKFDEVIVSARISLSGDPMPQAGDFSSKRVKLQLKDQAMISLNIKHEISDPANIPLVEQPADDAHAAVAAPVPTENTQAVEPVAIKAWVSLDTTMKANASADDTVFVMAKAKSGPPMPLAAKRLKVSDLPLEVTLDDSLAMMPQMKLSGFDEVVVSARISKSGQPMAAPGDISSETVQVSVSGTVGVNLNLDRVVQ